MPVFYFKNIIITSNVINCLVVELLVCEWSWLVVVYIQICWHHERHDACLPCANKLPVAHLHTWKQYLSAHLVCACTTLVPPVPHTDMSVVHPGSCNRDYWEGLELVVGKCTSESVIVKFPSDYSFVTNQFHSRYRRLQICTHYAYAILDEFVS